MNNLETGSAIMMDSRHFLKLVLSSAMFPLVSCAHSRKTPGLQQQAPGVTRPAPPLNAPNRGLRNPDLFVPQKLPASIRTTYTSVNVRGPFIAMTFDDGPAANLTPRLLDIMAKRNIKGTFYVIGRSCRSQPSILQRIAREGHELGNHSYTHPVLSKKSPAGWQKEIRDTHQAVLDITGKHCRTMRPPYGATNQAIKDWCRSAYGYPTILWTVDPLDWKRPGANVVAQRIISATRPGAIILAHDIHQGTIDAMPKTFDTLLAKGYQFVTMSQLIQLDRENPSVASSGGTSEKSSSPSLASLPVFSSGVW